MRPFPNPSEARTLISPRGGQHPVWARSGQELFYQSDDGLVAAQVLPGPDFTIGAVRVLFGNDMFRVPFDVAGDGRFVMVRKPPVDVGELIVVENFFEELKAKVGN